MRPIFKIYFAPALAALLLAGSSCDARAAALWDMAALSAPPRAEWCTPTGKLQQVYFDGEALSGKMTRVYAMYGKPEGAGPFPGVVLVHGGGGKVFPDWVKHWVDHGYAAIAMDTAGHGPAGRLADGGPDQSDGTKFRDFAGDDAKNMWTYHAVAAAIRAHSLLLSRSEVDPKKTALTGISWGGYLTCIISGIDHRFKAAVPVYGCGFLHENSTWLPSQLKPMTEERRNRWVEHFDPSKYLGEVSCPILFLDGTCDFAYPMDSLQKSYRLVKNAPVTLSVEINRKHGHIWNFPEVDAFIDSFVKNGGPLAEIGEMKIENARAAASVKSPSPIAKAELDYTNDSGNWQKRVWKTAPAEINGETVSASIPVERPLVCYLRVTDRRGCSVTTPHVELQAEKK
jgi:dienelactone hydrolase